MSTLSPAGRFGLPWLAYAALSGVGGAFILGAIVTLFGLAGGILSLTGGLAAGRFWKATTEVALLFPEYAFTVLFLSGIGLAGGFVAGLISSLIGKTQGLWWSVGFIAALSLFFFGDLLICVALTPSAFGVLLPNQFLDRRNQEKEWEKLIRHWMQATWLMQPSPEARIFGICLPIVLFFVVVGLKS